ncbi:hypothetical protein [Sphingomonas zeae]
MSTISRAEAMTFSSSTSLLKAFQLFQPMGGNAACPSWLALHRPVGVRGSILSAAATEEDIQAMAIALAKTLAMTGRMMILPMLVYRQSCPTNVPLSTAGWLKM